VNAVRSLLITPT